MSVVEQIEMRLPGDAALRTRAEQAVYHAQVYTFLAAVYLYLFENWSEDLLLAAAAKVNGAPAWPDLRPLALDTFQARYRRAFGAAGSLCYETEYGLPHEFRQAQELAGITGFYRVFGFDIGGGVRERPDHLAAELEFLNVLALKETHALLHGVAE